MTLPLYREHTPIEEHAINGVRVFVKRDDLYGRPPAPQLGKLRGLRVVLRKLFEDDVRLVGCWDTRVSKLGLGLAAACREFPGMHAVVSYPRKMGADLPPSIAAAKILGAEVFSMRGNHVAICYAQARKQIEKMGGRILPFGLECPEAVQAVAKEAAKTPVELLGGTVVLCCGSGVTLAGLLTGFPKLPSTLVGLSSGRSIDKIRTCLERYVPRLPTSLILRAPSVPYEVVCEAPCPFPSHGNYDRKAWELLTREIRRFREPILFWNIGA